MLSMYLGLRTTLSSKLWLIEKPPTQIHAVKSLEAACCLTPLGKQSVRKSPAVSVELSSNTVSRAGSHNRHPAGTMQNEGTCSHTHGLHAHTQRHKHSTRPGPTAPCSLTLHDLWHIQVVHEHQEALSHGRAVCVFGSLLNICFQISLDIQRWKFWIMA